MKTPIHLARKSRINRSLIPITVARSERARIGKHPCSTDSRLTSTWPELLRELKAFGESLRKGISRQKRIPHKAKTQRVK